MCVYIEDDRCVLCVLYVVNILINILIFMYGVSVEKMYSSFCQADISISFTLFSMKCMNILSVDKPAQDYVK